MVVVTAVQPVVRGLRTSSQAVLIRRHAAGVCRRLRTAVADRPDTWVTTRAWLDTAAGLLRPDVSVLSGAPPVDGLAEAVDLAVLWDATPTPILLRCGAREVWLVGGDTVGVHRGRSAATVRPGQELTVPVAGATVMVEDLLLPAAG